MIESSQPSLAEILAAARALAPTPPPSSADGMAKQVSTVLVGLVSAAFIAAATGLFSMSGTLASVKTTLDTVQKSVNDMQADRRADAGRISDIQTAVAKQDGRITAGAEGLDRVRERVRLLEGQPSLPVKVQRDE